MTNSDHLPFVSHRQIILLFVIEWIDVIKCKHVASQASIHSWKSIARVLIHKIIARGDRADHRIWIHANSTCSHSRFDSTKMENWNWHAQCIHAADIFTFSIFRSNFNYCSAVYWNKIYDLVFRDACRISEYIAAASVLTEWLNELINGYMRRLHFFSDVEIFNAQLLAFHLRRLIISSRPCN